MHKSSAREKSFGINFRFEKNGGNGNENQDKNSLWCPKFTSLDPLTSDTFHNDENYSKSPYNS